MMMPLDGQGARKVKSYMFAGGAIEMKPLISGRRISSCMPIHAPKLKPPTHVVDASGLNCCIQSSALAASDSSPMPLSNSALAAPDAAEVEAQRREAAADEGVVQRHRDRMVHRPLLRMRLEDDRDRRARAAGGLVTAFETALGTGKNDFGHGT